MVQWLFLSLLLWARLINLWAYFCPWELGILIIALVCFAGWLLSVGNSEHGEWVLSDSCYLILMELLPPLHQTFLINISLLWAWEEAAEESVRVALWRKGIEGSPVAPLAEVHSEPAMGERQLTSITEEPFLVRDPSVRSQVREEISHPWRA